jgi:hypothetical protein
MDNAPVHSAPPCTAARPLPTRTAGDYLWRRDHFALIIRALAQAPVASEFS